MRGVHGERDRAEGFGSQADAYNRTRPSYPEGLIDWLCRSGVGTAVDVGCGTGQVAILLATRGWSVVGLEPDRRMAAVARRRGVRVFVTTFERCALEGEQFDLICSGTAWHWVDPAIGYDRAAELLRPGGRLAVFRNDYSYDSAMASVIDSALTRHAPELLDDCIPLGTASDPLVERHAEEIAARPDLWHHLERSTFAHRRAVTTDDWITELETHSPIARLDPSRRGALLAELSEGARAANNLVRIRHEVPCVAATRRTTWQPSHR